MRSEDVNYSLTETTPLFTRSVQSHLGEVVFVELPEPSATVAAGGSFGNVESVKATSDVNSPISGEVVEVNSKLSETPGLVGTRLPSVYNTFL